MKSIDIYINNLGSKNGVPIIEKICELGDSEQVLIITKNLTAYKTLKKTKKGNLAVANDKNITELSGYTFSYVFIEDYLTFDSYFIKQINRELEFVTNADTRLIIYTAAAKDWINEELIGYAKYLKLNDISLEKSIIKLKAVHKLTVRLLLYTYLSEQIADIYIYD